MTSYSGTDNLEVMAEAKNYNAFLLDLILQPIKPADLLLDFGAGIGTFAILLKGLGYQVVCVESDSAQANAIAQQQIQAVTSMQMLSNESIDYVYTLNVLEHIENDVVALQEIYTKIKPGGRLLIYVPAFQCLYSSMDRKVGHWRRYTKRTLAPLVKTAGFEVEHASYVDSLGFFASYLYKYIGDSSGSLNRKSIYIYDRYLFPLSRLLDRLVGHWFGKNLVLLAHKPR
jgi:SAM-dependent methyltransferase